MRVFLEKKEKKKIKKFSLAEVKVKYCLGAMPLLRVVLWLNTNVFNNVHKKHQLEY